MDADESSIFGQLVAVVEKVALLLRSLLGSCATDGIAVNGTTVMSARRLAFVFYTLFCISCIFICLLPLSLCSHSLGLSNYYFLEFWVFDCYYYRNNKLYFLCAYHNTIAVTVRDTILWLSHEQSRWESELASISFRTEARINHKMAHRLSCSVVKCKFYILLITSLI